MSDQNANTGIDRRKFLGQAALGAGAIAGATGLGALLPDLAAAKASGPTAGDVAIVEAAQIDGASTFRIYRKVLLPTIAPIFLAVAVIQIQFAIKTFDLVAALTKGGPGISPSPPSTSMT